MNKNQSGQKNISPSHQHTAIKVLFQAHELPCVTLNNFVHNKNTNVRLIFSCDCWSEERTHPFMLLPNYVNDIMAFSDITMSCKQYWITLSSLKKDLIHSYHGDKTLAQKVVPPLQGTILLHGIEKYQVHHERHKRPEKKQNCLDYEHTGLQLNLSCTATTPHPPLKNLKSLLGLKHCSGKGWFFV